MMSSSDTGRIVSYERIGHERTWLRQGKRDIGVFDIHRRHVDPQARSNDRARLIGRNGAVLFGGSEQAGNALVIR